MNAPVVPSPTWTPFYDSTGQSETLLINPSAGELGVRFSADRLVLDLQGDADTAIAGSFGLSGAVRLEVPEELKLSGLLLLVDGAVTRTPGTQAVVMCAIGHGSHAREWPLASIAGNPSPDPPPNDGDPNPPSDNDGDPLIDEDFRLECFVSEFNPSSLGEPPFPPLPPVPITLAVHGRRRAADEALHVVITAFEVILLATA